MYPQKLVPAHHVLAHRALLSWYVRSNCGHPPLCGFFRLARHAACSIIAELFQTHGLTPPPNIAGLLMSGLIADTLNLRSPTTTPKVSLAVRVVCSFSSECPIVGQGAWAGWQFHFVWGIWKLGNFFCAWTT